MNKSPQEGPNPSEQDIEQKVRSAYENIEHSPDLWKRIQNTAGKRDSQSSLPPFFSEVRTFFNTRWLAPAFALAICLMVAGIAWAPFSSRQIEAGSNVASLADFLTSEFSTFVASGRNLDIESSDINVLKTWFGSRLEAPFPPTPPTVSSLGLTGGRLCQLQGKRIASFMYKVDEKEVALYLTNQEDTNERAVQSLEVSTQNSVTYATWQQMGWRYSLVATLPSQQMSEIATRLRHGKSDT